jgi:hypothetical protein
MTQPSQTSLCGCGCLELASIVASGLNTLYTLRTPSLTISASVVHLLAYPVGKLWEKLVPSWNVPLGNSSFNLNPGPFNTKVSH